MADSVHPAANLFPLLEGVTLDALVADIRAHGLREPVVLYDGRILDGRNRARACEIAGVKLRTRNFDGNPWAYVWSANAARRDLTPGQKVAIRLKALDGERAWEEKRAKGKSRKPSDNVDGSKPADRETRSELAKSAGVGSVTAQKALTVQAEAPEKFAAVCAGQLELNQAYRTVQRERAVANIQAEPAPLPSGPFHVIVADPPWAYEKRKDDGTHRAALTYPDMTTDEICALPIKPLGHEDSILWLWTTNAFMRDAFRVIDAWGFKEKTILTWTKDRMGTGDWLRGRTEHCVLCVRGKPTVTLTNQTTILEGAVREHSRKPESFYALVESLCPGSKLELFARQQRDGWHTWGAETSAFEAKK
jgi:N6-adenosine-specific RNA methylase IME4